MAGRGGRLPRVRADPWGEAGAPKAVAKEWRKVRPHRRAGADVAVAFAHGSRGGGRRGVVVHRSNAGRKAGRQAV